MTLGGKYTPGPATADDKIGALFSDLRIALGCKDNDDDNDPGEDWEENDDDYDDDE